MNGSNAFLSLKSRGINQTADAPSMHQKINEAENACRIFVIRFELVMQCVDKPEAN